MKILLILTLIISSNCFAQSDGQKKSTAKEVTKQLLKDKKQVLQKRESDLTEFNRILDDLDLETLDSGQLGYRLKVGAGVLAGVAAITTIALDFKKEDLIRQWLYPPTKKIGKKKLKLSKIANRGSKAASLITVAAIISIFYMDGIAKSYVELKENELEILLININECKIKVENLKEGIEALEEL